MPRALADPGRAESLVWEQGSEQAQERSQETEPLSGGVTVRPVHQTLRGTLRAPDHGSEDTAVQRLQSLDRALPAQPEAEARLERKSCDSQ